MEKMLENQRVFRRGFAFDVSYGRRCQRVSGRLDVELLSMSEFDGMFENRVGFCFPLFFLLINDKTILQNFSLDQYSLNFLFLISWLRLLVRCFINRNGFKAWIAGSA